MPKFTEQNKWKFEKKDTYSLDWTFSRFIHAGLVKFRKDIETVGSVPNSCLPELPKGEFNYSEEDLKKGFTKWTEMIDEMIIGFDYDGLASLKGNTQEHSNYQDRMDKGRELFIKYYQDLWW